MRITESRLRSIIRSVILENSMFQYEEDDFDKKNELASDLSSMFFILIGYKYDLENPQLIQQLIKELGSSNLNASDVKMFVEKVGDMYSQLKVSFDLFNKVGFDDNIIERACDYGDNSYWASCYPGKEGRYVMLGDPADI